MAKYIIKETTKSITMPFGQLVKEKQAKQVTNYYQGEGAEILGMKIQAWNRNKKTARRFDTKKQATIWLKNHHYKTIGIWCGWSKSTYSVRYNKKIDIIEVEK